MTGNTKDHVNTVEDGCSSFGIKLTLKSSYATYPTSNAKSLACDTANEHALERHAAAVRQLSNGTNGDDRCMYSNDDPCMYSNGREHYSIISLP